MGLLKKRERHSVDRRRSLAGIPILHDNVKIIESPEGTISLQLRVGRGDGLLDFFRPAVTERKYDLDEFGSFVVKEIQRRKTVLDIVRSFERRFGMSHREAELGVVAFIKILMNRNVLSVAVE